jgi:hypothetical protein
MDCFASLAMTDNKSLAMTVMGDTANDQQQTTKATPHEQ